MASAQSKLTSKYQATIPESVRKTLGLKAGDSVTFDIDRDEIRIRKTQPFDLAFAQSLEHTLSEWNSDADEEAYRDL